MNNEGLKNIVLLKDLPSNLIEEAIIVLKENKKIHKVQKIIDINNEKKRQKNDKQNKNKNENNLNKNEILNKNIDNDYIIKEAYMLLDDYTKRLETETPSWKNNVKKLERKYKYSVKLNIILSISITLVVILNIFIK
jgi:hypothetical protein